MPHSPPFLALFDSFGGLDMVILLLLVLVFFGGEKMPEFARGLGKLIRQFKQASSGIEAEIKKAMEEPQQYVPPRSRHAPPPTIETPLPPTFDDPTPGHKIMEHPLPVDPETPSSEPGAPIGETPASLTQPISYLPAHHENLLGTEVKPEPSQPLLADLPPPSVAIEQPAHAPAPLPASASPAAQPPA